MKPWTFKDDASLHEYADALGAGFIAEQDLHRSAAAGKARARHLKATGAWQALSDMKAAEDRYHVALGHRRFCEEVAA